LLFHVHYVISNVGMFVLVLFVGLVALYGLGVMLSSIFLMWGREAWHTTNAFIEPIYFVSGFYFPVRALGFWGGISASIVPLTLALDALRQLMYGKAHPRLLSAGLETGLLGVLAVLFVVGARFSLRKMELLARREGRLGLRE
jgi:ABC-2 type transport system permease protein